MRDEPRLPSFPRARVPSAADAPDIVFEGRLGRDSVGSVGLNYVVAVVEVSQLGPVTGRRGPSVSGGRLPSASCTGFDHLTWWHRPSWVIFQRRFSRSCPCVEIAVSACSLYGG